MASFADVFPLFPTPDHIFRSYLVTGERVIHVDKPALDAFLVIEIRKVLVTAGLLAFTLWAAFTGKGTIVVLVGFIAFDVFRV